jgi:hypothetical protein
MNDLFFSAFLYNFISILCAIFLFRFALKHQDQDDNGHDHDE